MSPHHQWPLLPLNIWSSQWLQSSSQFNPSSLNHSNPSSSSSSSWTSRWWTSSWWNHRTPPRPVSPIRGTCMLPWSASPQWPITTINQRCTTNLPRNSIRASCRLPSRCRTWEGSSTMTTLSWVSVRSRVRVRCHLTTPSQDSCPMAWWMAIMGRWEGSEVRTNFQTSIKRCFYKISF